LVCAAHQRLSFTLPLELPRHSNVTGLRYYLRDESACSWQDVAAGNTSASNSHRCLRGPYVSRYRVGQLSYHIGYLLHAIEPWPFHSGADSRRATLQGFCYLCNTGATGNNIDAPDTQTWHCAYH
jgi:hypothetical protein